MAKVLIYWLFAAILFNSGGITTGQSTARQVSQSNRSCALAGTYRINVVDSDKLYSVVKDATSTVPFGDQQRFFMDLSTRLTPPDILAIECSGNQVSVASSRASKVTYLADGRTKRERGASGNFVNSRIEMKRDSLTFISTGDADDNVNVAFQSLDTGNRLSVTRRIYAAQLSEPIIIRTVYDRIAERVDWNDFDDRTVARRSRPEAGVSPPRTATSARLNQESADESASALRDALNEWIDATNRRDIAVQMRFYVPVLAAYYLTRNTPQNKVRAEKRRVFDGVRSVDIRAGEPEIIFQDNGRTAVMRFIKEYRIVDRARTKSGVVVQELRWQRAAGDWRIFSERDIRVIR